MDSLLLRSLPLDDVNVSSARRRHRLSSAWSQCLHCAGDRFPCFFGVVLARCSGRMPSWESFVDGSESQAALATLHRPPSEKVSEPASPGACLGSGLGAAV